MSNGSSRTTDTIEAAGLLLRSPLWTVTQVLDLLDIGDAEFRRMVRDNAPLADILERRRLNEVGIRERRCRVCGNMFSTARFRNHCGAPACRAVLGMERG